MSTETVAAEAAPVIVERRGRLGLLTLNRPKAINALTHEMVGIIDAALRRWADDPGIQTVALIGAGERGLCAGGDIVSIYHDAIANTGDSERFWRDEYALNHAISVYPKPYLAVMDGLVLGGGVGLSAHASHRVVTERTRIGMPETGIGFVPDVGGTWLLARAPGELGTYIALTAGHVGAGDAVALGLADAYVESDRVEELLALLTEHEADEALARIASPVPMSDLMTHRHWIDAAFGHDDMAQILDALRASTAPTAEHTLRTVLAKSPTSQAVTLRALREAASMATLGNALQVELRLALRMLRAHDMREGIRAQVIDKDRAPQWRPAAHVDVDPASVDAYFRPLEHELTF